MIWFDTLFALMVWLSLRIARPMQSQSTFDKALDVCLFLSLCTGLALVLSGGSIYQYYLHAAITSSETNLYATAYKEGLAQFFSFTKWREYVGGPFTSIPAIITIAAAYFATNSREILLNTFIACLISLCAADVISGIISSDITVTYLLENILSNAAGAAVTAGCALFGFRAIDFLLLQTSTAVFPKTAIAIMTPILLGGAIHAFAYSALFFFYAPTQANIDLYLTTPIDIWYGSDAIPTGENRTSNSHPSHSFDTLSNATDIQTPVNMTQVEGRMAARWRPGNGELSTTTVVLFADCDNDQIRNLLSSQKLPKKTTGVDELEVNVGSGMAVFQFIADSTSASSFFLSNPDRIKKFWLEKATKKKDALQIQRFLNNQSKMHFWSLNGDLLFSITTPALAEESEVMKLANRTFEIKINNASHFLRFAPPKQIDQNHLRGCRSLDVPNVLTAKFIDIDANASEFGIAIQLHQDQNLEEFNWKEHNSLVVDASNGWLQIDNIPGGELQPFIVPGTLNTLTVQQHVDRLKVYGEPILFNVGDQLSMTDGSLVARLDSTQALSIYGTARALFRNSTRLNRTRWEGLDVSIKVFLGTLVVSLCSYAMIALISMARRNDLLYWTSN